MIVLMTAKSVDPDEMSHFAAFHLGLHFFSKYSFLGDSGLQRVNLIIANLTQLYQNHSILSKKLSLTSIKGHNCVVIQQNLLICIFKLLLSNINFNRLMTPLVDPTEIMWPNQHPLSSRQISILGSHEIYKSTWASLTKRLTSISCTYYNNPS